MAASVRLGRGSAWGARVEARCLMALSLWIGNHFLAADHGGRSRAEALERAARLLEG
jgi:hypothetical protein